MTCHHMPCHCKEIIWWTHYRSTWILLIKNVMYQLLFALPVHGPDIVSPTVCSLLHIPLAFLLIVWDTTCPEATWLLIQFILVGGPLMTFVPEWLECVSWCPWWRPQAKHIALAIILFGILLPCCCSELCPRSSISTVYKLFSGFVL